MATRRATLARSRQRSRRAGSGEDAFLRKLCGDIRKGELIPIVGDTVRNAHIFDIDFDQRLGPSVGEEEGGEDDPAYRQMAEYRRIKDRLSITDELAFKWAVDVGYPLLDSYRLARVAQYLALEEGDPARAKENYLDFCKWYLLEQIDAMPEVEEDIEEQALVAELRHDADRLSFSDIVDEMDFPRFPEDHHDPLRILARLPLKIYLTTGYYDFIERELTAMGKRPRSRLCFWKPIEPANVAPEHQPDPNYRPDIANPIVYHLFGMEQYPESLVLSEDDHLTFLAQVAGRDPDGEGTGVIPPYLVPHLRNSALLLLGYRLQDWDFRTLFHVLLNPESDFTVDRTRKGWAIQLALEQQPLVADQKKAGEYLAKYFDGARFNLEWGESDDFMERLWQEYQR